jgi:hypothetical protein
VLLLDWENVEEAAIRNRGLQGCDKESVFWMVQLMESWFLADFDALRTVFKRNLNEAALAGNPKVEEIPKADVMERLNRATNGKYRKVEHGVKLLENIDVRKVRSAGPHCERMFATILAKLT